MVRPLTQHLVDSLFFDMWPRPAAIVDFGLDTQAHYEALHRTVRKGEITAEQLDTALGDGEKLTELVNNAPSNPYKGIVFRTSYDMPEEPEEN